MPGFRALELLRYDEHLANAGERAADERFVTETRASSRFCWNSSSARDSCLSRSYRAQPSSSRAAANSVSSPTVCQSCNRLARVDRARRRPPAPRVDRPAVGQRPGRERSVLHVCASASSSLREPSANALSPARTSRARRRAAGSGAGRGRAGRRAQRAGCRALRSIRSDPGQAAVEPFRVRELGEREVVSGVPVAHRFGLAACLETARARTRGSSPASSSAARRPSRGDGAGSCRAVTGAGRGLRSQTSSAASSVQPPAEHRRGGRRAAARPHRAGRTTTRSSRAASAGAARRRGLPLSRSRR